MATATNIPSFEQLSQAALDLRYNQPLASPQASALAQLSSATVKAPPLLTQLEYWLSNNVNWKFVGPLLVILLIVAAFGGAGGGGRRRRKGSSSTSIAVLIFGGWAIYSYSTGGIVRSFVGSVTSQLGLQTRKSS